MKTAIVTAETIGGALKIIPNPSSVLSSKAATLELYHRVARQPDIFSKTQNYKDAVCAMTLNAADDFFALFLAQKNINTKELIRWAVSARDYGFAVIEIIEYGIVGGKTVPTQFKYCKPEQFAIGANGELRYISSKTGAAGIDVQAVYPNKFIWLKNEASAIMPYGTSLYDTAYWLAVGLNGNYEAIITLSEEDGADKWIGKHLPDATQEQKYELLEMLLKIKSAGVAVVPQGTDIAPVEYKGRSTTAALYQNIDEMLRRKLELLWFGTDLLMKDSTGSYSSSNIGYQIREDALAQGVDLVISCFNQINAFIAAINGSAETDIELTMTSPRTITTEEANVDKTYFDMGMRPTAAFFLNRGYKENEFTLVATDTPPATQNAEFGAKIDQLGELFEVYRNPK
jgi:hypothetical protein